MVKKKAEVAATAVEEFVDGRAQRGLQNKQSIVDALIALIQAGNLSPTADQVATESGVALRTVFRHFEDMQSLFAELGAVADSALQAASSGNLKGDSWADKLNTYIDKRLKAFEDNMALLTSTSIHQHDSVALGAAQVASAAAQRKQWIALLPKKAQGNKMLLDALDASFSFDSYARLRRDQQLGAAAAKKVVKFSVEQLLKGQA